jgi:hypothetical protein
MNFDLFNKYFDILPYDFKIDIFDNNEKYKNYCTIDNEMILIKLLNIIKN